MPVMNLFARAAATRHQNSRRHEDEYKFNIDIPHELLESVRSGVAAEVERLDERKASGGQSWHIRRLLGRDLGSFDAPTLPMPRNARRR